MAAQPRFREGGASSRLREPGLDLGPAPRPARSGEAIGESMNEPMVLVLEDGFAIQGERGGDAWDAGGELVFNTCMTGYQEVLSDPSYAGQMVVMTYPLIGNYGTSPDFLESGRHWARALITRQVSTFQQHWRSHQSLAEWLDGYGVPIITGCDTRRLARHLRGTGAQRAVIGPRHELSALHERVQRVTPLE